MLIPLDNNVGISTISLSLIYFFKEKIFYSAPKKSILYFSCVNNTHDSMFIFLKKHCSKFVHFLKNIDFSQEILNSSEYFSLLNKTIENIYKNKALYELILIEGIQQCFHVDATEINHDISQNVSAEVIFLDNLKKYSFQNVQEKVKKIKCLTKRKKYKNVLGIIFNKINSPLIEKKYSFIKKLKIINNINKNIITLVDHEKIFRNVPFPIIASIPWNKNIQEIYSIDIYKYLNVELIHLEKKYKNIVKEIMIFDENDINLFNKNSSNIFVIVAFSRLKDFIKMLHIVNANKKKIIAIILTSTSLSKEKVIFLCKTLIEQNIEFSITKKNTIEILTQLQNFTFHEKLNNIEYVSALKEYICSFFDLFYITAKKKFTYGIKYSPKEFCYNLKLLSRKKNKRIILPESYEIRILQAVSICQENNIAQCVLLGDAKKIYSIANHHNIFLQDNIEIINPDSIREKYIKRFLELRKHKVIDQHFARKQLENNITLATLILESNAVDGLVSGSVNTTADTIRPALQLIKTDNHSSLVSSSLFMLLHDEVLIYSDCAININPNAEELAEIALQSSRLLEIFGIEPRIAMLSYSTGFSGSGSTVDKIRTATRIVKNKKPNVIIDGPIQYDAAVSKTVCKLKAPDSPILGSANIFIFPDLNAGNIAYKAVQRSANTFAIGPILQGLKKPVNDLSRGASVEDIIYTIALTSIQAI